MGYKSRILLKHWPIKQHLQKHETTKSPAFNYPIYPQQSVCSQPLKKTDSFTRRTQHSISVPLYTFQVTSIMENGTFPPWEQNAPFSTKYSVKSIFLSCDFLFKYRRGVIV